MDNKTENNSAASKVISAVYFVFVVLFSSLILWVLSSMSVSLNAIPKNQLPESLLYPSTFILYPLFLRHIVARCLKTIPLSTYGVSVGVVLILLITILLVSLIGIFDFTLIPGHLLI
jgi:hypothetical protein